MKIDNLLSEKMTEFMPDSYYYDIEHKLAEKAAEYALLVLQLRAHNEKMTEWSLNAEIIKSWRLRVTH